MTIGTPNLKWIQTTQCNPPNQKDEEEDEKVGTYKELKGKYACPFGLYFLTLACCPVQPKDPPYVTYRHEQCQLLQPDMLIIWSRPHLLSLAHMHASHHLNGTSWPFLLVAFLF